MIPSIAHFVWYGPRLPYLHALAIRSAATHGGFDSVRLHHADPLEDLPHVEALRRTRNVAFLPLDDRALCEQAGGASLAELVGQLDSPVARSNLVRTALLYRDGGVYLDMDTLTVRSFDEVRTKASGFVGEEHIVFPAEVVSSWNPLVKTKAYLQTAVRDLYRRMPHGYRHFRRIERHYRRAVNGAVMGGVSGHAFWQQYLAAMSTVPRERWNKPHALGTHLLQTTYKRYSGSDLYSFPPPYFYPLSPEISAHWFRVYRKGADPTEVLDSITRCVHWYASVRTKDIVKNTGESELRALAGRQLFATLAVRVLDGRSVDEP